MTIELQSDNLILMPEISATEAARNFSDLMDSVEHSGAHYTVIRRGRPIARITPVTVGKGTALKEALRLHLPDRDWIEDVYAVRDLLDADSPR